MTKPLFRLLLCLAAVAAMALLSAALVAQEAQPTPVKTAPATRPAVTTAPAAMTAEQEEELLAFFKKHDSPQYARLMDLKKANPQVFETTARAWYNWINGIKDMPGEVQKAYVVQQEAYTNIYRKVADIRSAASDELRQQRIGELREQVTELYKAQIVVRDYKVSQLETQLDELRKGLKAAEADPDGTIDRSMQDWLKMAGLPTKDPSPAATPSPVPASGPTKKITTESPAKLPAVDK